MNSDQRKHRLPLPVLAVVVLSVVLAGMVCGAQLAMAQEPAKPETAQGSTPDSPQTQENPNPVMQSTTRVLGYMTNKSFAFPDLAYAEGPLTSSKKFKLFVNQSISPPYVLAAAFSAGFDQLKSNSGAYGDGVQEFGARFGSDLARASSSSFFGTFALASILRQDPRFYPLTRSSLWGNVKYSAQRVFITRTDAGHDTFNTSGILGIVAAEGLANVYLPVADQSGAKNAVRMASDLGWKFAGNLLRSYWPAISRKLGINQVIPVPATQP
ncbi:MAG: hypothetical protein ABSD20_12015 [Terriglobales bacterium]|jgi:hypothetical protein